MQGSDKPRVISLTCSAHICFCVPIIVMIRVLQLVKTIIGCPCFPFLVQRETPGDLTSFPSFFTRAPSFLVLPHRCLYITIIYIFILPRSTKNFPPCGQLVKTQQTYHKQSIFSFTLNSVDNQNTACWSDVPYLNLIIMSGGELYRNWRHALPELQSKFCLYHTHFL